jgi:hypothetical protein
VNFPLDKNTYTVVYLNCGEGRRAVTKKDFELLAGVMRAVRPDTDRAETYGKYRLDLAMIAQWDNTVRALVDALASTNPRFDRERFLKACKKNGKA